MISAWKRSDVMAAASAALAELLVFCSGGNAPGSQE